MDSKTFLSKLADYYGVKPTQGQLVYLAQYISPKNERFLDYLFAEVLKSHSSSFKSFPDIAAYEAATPKAFEAWEYGKTTNSLPSPDVLRLTDGAKSEAVIEGLEDILKDLHVKNWKG